MAVPTDFASFAGGWDLTAANYSGGTNGEFANLLAGQAPAIAQGIAPTFETKSDVGWSMEGVAMAGSAGYQLNVDIPVHWECTVVLIAQTNAQGSIMYPFGGRNTAANTWGMTHYTRTAQAFNGMDSSGYTAANALADTRPLVYAMGFCPRPDVGQTWAVINDGTVKVGPQTADTYERARIVTAQCAIGQHRASYYNGWIGRVLLFSRSLYHDDPSGLASLITTEMASVGL